MSAAIAGDLRLRPGSAVHVVDEGLLFCGWRSSALMTCGSGVITLWQAVAPALAAGVDPAQLCDQLPDRVVPAFEVLLAELGNHQMLAEAPGPEGGSPAADYLAQFAPDVRAAGIAASLARLRVLGDGEQVKLVVGLLTAAGLCVPQAEQAEPAGQRGHAGQAEQPEQAVTMTVYLGSIEQFESEGRPVAAITALGVADRVLVADTPDGPDRLLHGCRAVAGTPAPGAPAPGAILMDFGRQGGQKSATSGLGASRLSWALARSVLVERVHRQLAGLVEQAAATMVARGGAVTVRLAEKPRPARPVDWPELPPASTAPVPAASAAQAVAEVPELGAGLIGPQPGDLLQVPMSRQLVELRAARYCGAGADQHRAGRDAVRNAARAELRSASGGRLTRAGDADPSGWLVAPLPVAGFGGRDLLAGVIGQSLVALAGSVEPAEQGLTELTPDELTGLSVSAPAAARWLQSVSRLAGPPVLHAGPSSRIRSVTLCRAAAGDRVAWGYGAELGQAGEHALRGLLAGLVNDPAGSADRLSGDTDLPDVPVAHEEAVVEPLLQAALGRVSEQPVAVVLDRLGGLVTGLHTQAWNLGPEFGRLGVDAAMVGVAR